MYNSEIRNPGHSYIGESWPHRLIGMSR